MLDQMNKIIKYFRWQKKWHIPLKYLLRNNGMGIQTAGPTRLVFKKIKDTLGYKTKYTVEDGAKEIYSALKNGTLTDSVKTKTVEWYKYLLESKKVSDSIVIKNTVL